MRRITLVAILGFGILLLFGCGERQASITGVVTDSESGNPLRDAVVTLEEHTAKTGSDGHYHLDKVPPGSYTLTVRMEGYKSYDRQIDAQENQEVILDIVLSPLEEPTPLPIAEEGQGPHRVIERVSSTISPDKGGSIVITEAESIYSNGFTLSIPPGALEEETVITVGDVTDDFPPIPNGLRPVGLPISLEPHGLAFQIPIIVKIPYSDEMLAWTDVTSPEDLLLKTYDLSTNEWTNVPIVQVDTQNSVIVAEIDHFSLFSLFSWWNQQETEDPATDKQILTYINDSWGVVAVVDDLARWNANTGIPFKDEIGGILTVIAMAEQVQSEKYRKAAITGGEWLAWLALKAAGYGWLRPFALFVEGTYKGGEWFVKEVDKNAFNSQVCAYLYYRNEGYSDEEIQKTFGFVDDEGWLLATGTGCPPWRPRLTGRFKPEDVFRIGRLVWNAKLSGSYKQRDIESIKDAFIHSIRPVEPNRSPQVDITSPSEAAVFTVGEVVSLEGKAVDPEDGLLTGPSLTWRIETAGTSMLLDDGETLSLSNLAVGSHKISLAAKDSQGETVEDSIEITVQAAANMPPEVTIASPSDGTTFAEGDSILFTGSAIDPEDGPLADRALIWVSGIDGVLGPGHTVTRDNLSPGTHAITLSATDSHSVFSTKTITITIEPSIPNEPPIAAAAADQTVYVEDTVTLDGSASYDPDNDPLTFRWTQSSGPSVVLSNTTLQKVTFIPKTAGTYNFRLTVNDGRLDSPPDHVSITVRKEPSVGQQDAVGEYIDPLIPDDCLEINADGTCYMEIMGMNVGLTGRWKVDSSEISLIFPDGTTFRGTVKIDAILLDGFGMLPVVWVKATKSSPGILDLAGKYVRKDHRDEYLVLNEDGTYTKTEKMFDELWTESGEWDLDNHAVTLQGDTSDLSILAAVLDNRLYFTGLFGTDIWIGEPREEPTQQQVSLAKPSSEPEATTPSGQPPEVEWQKFFDSGDEDYGVEVQQLSDGGYVVLALTSQETNSDNTDDWVPPITWLIKTDKSGSTQWDRRFSEGKAIGESIQQVQDGGFIIVGTKPITPEGGSGTDAWLAKLDQSANIKWERTFGGTEEWYDDSPSMVCEAGDGGYVFVGETRGNVWLLKTDRLGQKEWEKAFTGESRDWGLSVEQTDDGGYIIGGLSFRETGSRANEDIWLIKTDQLGRKEWERFFGGESIESVGYVRQTRDGGYIIVGTTEADEGHWCFNLWLIKTDASGNKVWDKTFDRVFEQAPSCVCQTVDGGYVICTTSEEYRAGETVNGLWLLKTDCSGNAQWSEIFGENAMGAFVEQTKDGGYIAVGTDLTGSAGGDVWLIKLKGTGVEPSAER